MAQIVKAKIVNLSFLHSRLGTGIVGLTSAIIKAVEFIITHWDAIKHMAGSFYLTKEYSKREKVLLTQARQISIDGRAIIGNNPSDEEVLLLRIKFSALVKALPPMAKKTLAEQLGEEVLEKIIDVDECNVGIIVHKLKSV